MDVVHFFSIIWIVACKNFPRFYVSIPGILNKCGDAISADRHFIPRHYVCKIFYSPSRAIESVAFWRRVQNTEQRFSVLKIGPLCDSFSPRKDRVNSRTPEGLEASFDCSKVAPQAIGYRFLRHAVERENYDQCTDLFSM